MFMMTDFELPDGCRSCLHRHSRNFRRRRSAPGNSGRRGVPYTGEGVEGSRAAFDKILSKEKFREHDVATPDWEVIEVGQRPTIPIPVCDKAAATGFHRWRADRERTRANLTRRWRMRPSTIDELLIEKFVSGRELTIGILGDQALPILEIIPKGGFYDFTNKYPFLNPQAGGGAEHVCPAQIVRRANARNSGTGAACVSRARPERLFAR